MRLFSNFSRSFFLFVILVPKESNVDILLYRDKRDLNRSGLPPFWGNGAQCGAGLILPSLSTFKLTYGCRFQSLHIWPGLIIRSMGDF